MTLWISLIFLISGLVLGQDIVSSSLLRPEHRGDSCNCMEYWGCINSDGTPIAYCGLTESMVCCTFPPQKELTKSQCGIKGFDSGRIGIAEPSEWPWHVAIVEEPGFYYACGGSLIDESWVLTAAHCVAPYTSETNKKLKVRLGEHDVTASTEVLPHEDRSVRRVVVHPLFNASSVENDIALLRLETPARRRHHIDVVCLPEYQQSVNVDASCFITGWGRVAQDSGYSPILKEIPIPLWENRDCEIAMQKEFGSNFRLQNNTICAGSTGRDACDGDGGGPLVCQSGGQWFQRGVVSYGFGCGERGIPGVYTRVSNFRDWIQQVTDAI